MDSNYIFDRASLSNIDGGAARCEEEEGSKMWKKEGRWSGGRAAPRGCAVPQRRLLLSIMVLTPSST
jgi:hypothetical protein